MDVSFHPAAADEFRALPVRERGAMQAAVQKLEAYGDSLGFPHSFYRRIGEAMVIGAVGPEANVDLRGFRTAVQRAENRLAEVERGEVEP